MEPAPLAVPATPERLRALRDAGVLSDAAFGRAHALVNEPPPRAEQARFAAQAGLVLGALLGLASVVFFVAHNWGGMSRWARFGALEAAFVGFGLLALRARAQRGRKLALTACAVLLGPLLAVYGQTYQTGADPYELFLSWALLAAPFAALARLKPLWLGVLALLDVSAALWCVQLQPLPGD